MTRIAVLVLYLIAIGGIVALYQGATAGSLCRSAGSGIATWGEYADVFRRIGDDIKDTCSHRN